MPNVSVERVGWLVLLVGWLQCNGEHIMINMHHMQITTLPLAPIYLQLGVSELRVWSLALVLGMVAIGVLAYPLLIRSRLAQGRSLIVSETPNVFDKSAESKPIELSSAPVTATLMMLQVAIACIALGVVVGASWWATWLLKINPFVWYLNWHTLTHLIAP
jgi:hypothetical protein